MILGSQRTNSIAQALLFTIFLFGQNLFVVPASVQQQLPSVIKEQTARSLSLGEATLFGRVIHYWLQSYDSQSGQVIAYKEWNYERLADWLRLILRLDPSAQEPLLAASRIYIEVKDEKRIRTMVALVQEQYLLAPNERWRWMVDATLIAKHRLHDRSLALQMARALREHSKDKNIPYWVSDMEHLILAELGEWESASLIITSMLESGTIQDGRELQFLTKQLEELSKSFNK